MAIRGILLLLVCVQSGVLGFRVKGSAQIEDALTMSDRKAGEILKIWDKVRVIDEGASDVVGTKDKIGTIVKISTSSTRPFSVRFSGCSGTNICKDPYVLSYKRSWLKVYCNDWDVRLSSIDHGTPEVCKSEAFHPICGHYFWNNNKGATSFCMAWGYRKDRRYTKGIVHKLGGAYSSDAVEIRTWGTFHVKDGEVGLTSWCSAGKDISFDVTCS